MAALHCADLTSSFWYRVAKQTLGLTPDAGEGGESFPDAPQGSQSVTDIDGRQLNIDGRQLHFVGAVG